MAATTDENTWRLTVLRRELRRHSKALEFLAAELAEAEAYPTETAAKFCTLIKTTAELIASRIDSAPADKLPHIHTLVLTLGEHLRFAERSRIEQTPWSMVQATEAFLVTHSEERCSFIVRPQWSYNYSIKGEFVSAYKGFLEAIDNWITVAEWERAIGKAAQARIYCISFPRVERMNVLMHVNWGHEVGHIHASDWVNANFSSAWQAAEPDIKSRIKAHLEKATWSPREDLLKTVYLDQYVAKWTKETMDLARFGLKELISDCVGAHLLGPAALASLSDFSSRFELDANPRACGYYPPWRFRLRKISEALSGDFLRTDLFQGISRASLMEPYIRFLKKTMDLTVDKSDQAEIESDIRTREAYALIERQWPSVAERVIRQLPAPSQKRYKLKDRVAVVTELVLRLQNGIPPNETGTWPNSAPAPLADIWNGAWAFKCLCCERPEWGSPDDYEDIFRLVLKGIESSYVHSTFGPRLAALPAK